MESSIMGQLWGGGNQWQLVSVYVTFHKQSNKIGLLLLIGST